MPNRTRTALICVAVCSLSLATAVGLWSMASGGKSLPLPLIAAKDSDKAAVEEWLRKNLDSGEWEEVQWWPAFDQTEPIQKRIADVKQRVAKGVSDSDRVNATILLRALDNAHRRVARMRYRTANKVGAMELQDSIFAITDTGVIAEIDDYAHTFVATEEAGRALDSRYFSVGF